MNSVLSAPQIKVLQENWQKYLFWLPRIFYCCQRKHHTRESNPSTKIIFSSFVFTHFHAQTSFSLTDLSFSVSTLFPLSLRLADFQHLLLLKFYCLSSLQLYKICPLIYFFLCGALISGPWAAFPNLSEIIHIDWSLIIKCNLVEWNYLRLIRS